MHQTPQFAAHRPDPATTVGEIMTRRVVTITMDDDVRHIREVFVNEKFHHLIVVERGRVVGVVSDRDLLKHLSPFVGRPTERSQDADTLRRRAHQVMTRPLISCGPECSLAVAAKLMLDHRVSCLPVLDANSRCLGIVTIRDLLAWALVRTDQSPGECSIPEAA